MVDSTENALCRVSIQRIDRPLLVDLALPRYAQLGTLLPGIVDLAVAADPPGTTPPGWRLDRICGGRLDESVTLQDNDVHDGDVLVLSAATDPAPGPLGADPYRTVATTDPPDQDRGGLPAAAWVWAAMASAAGLGYSGAATGSAVGTLLIAVAAAATSVFAAHHRACSTVRLRWHAGAVMFATVAGYLAVPGAPGMANVLLAAGVGCAVSALLVRSLDADTRCFTATATAAALLAVVMAVAVAVPVDLVRAGALLAVLAVAILGAAGRLAIMLTGLGPAFPGQPASGQPVSEVTANRAARGRDVLAGLVTGSAAAIAVAAGMIAAGTPGTGAQWPQRAALTAVITALLLLRVRLYADPRCRVALSWCGILCVTAVFAQLWVSVPQYAGGLGVLTLGVSCWCSAKRTTVSPVLTRTVELVEYALLAAVVPLVCWVAGIYELTRSLAIT